MYRAVGSKKNPVRPNLHEGWRAKHAITLGGLGACSPMKIFKITPSKTASGGFSDAKFI